METEKRKKFIVDFLYCMILLGIAIYVCRYALQAVAPFVIALVVSLLLRPVIRFLQQKCRVQKNVAGIVVVVLFYALIGFLLVILGAKLFAACKDFFLNLPILYRTTVEPFLYRLFDDLEAFVVSVDPTVSAEGTSSFDVLVTRLTSSLGSKVADWSGRIVGGVTSLTLKTPKLLLNTLITVIATVFTSIDLPLFKRFVKAQFSQKNQRLLHNIREHLSSTLGRYVRSYSLILLITFCELFLGLSIIGVEGTLGLSALIAVFDILPVVGCGTVLIPWSIICVIQANYPRALGVIIVYLVILVVRNIIEPKIVGDHVGLHPIITLSGMVAGTYVFGGVGLLGLPVTLALVKSLNDDGIIHMFNEPDPENDAPPIKKKKKLFPFRKAKPVEDVDDVE